MFRSVPYDATSREARMCSLFAELCALPLPGDPSNDVGNRMDILLPCGVTQVSLIHGAVPHDFLPRIFRYSDKTAECSLQTQNSARASSDPPSADIPSASASQRPVASSVLLHEDTDDAHQAYQIHQIDHKDYSWGGIGQLRSDHGATLD